MLEMKYILPPLKFNFTDIGPGLANDIPQTNERFEDYIMPSDSRFTPRETHAVLYK